LAAFSRSTRCWCGLRRDVDLRRRYGAFLHFRDDWPDESIAAAWHGFDPTIAARGLAEHPAQRRDLDGKIAFLHQSAGPRSFNQRVFRHQYAWLFNQGSQQGNRSPAKRYGRTFAEQQVVLGVQTKWSQRVDRHNRPIVIALREISEVFQIGLKTCD
jgi:hypothetical protein